MRHRKFCMGSAAMNAFRLSLTTLILALLALPAHAEGGRPADNTPKLAFGQMVQYGEKLIFSPCRDQSYTHLEDISSDGRVVKALNMVGLAAGKKIYAELLGVNEDGVLKASQINLAKANGRCQLPGGREESWRAAGSQPDWILAFGSEVVQVKPLGKSEVDLPAGPVKIENGVATFEASRDNQKLALRFEQSLCRDQAADAVFGWTATVELNGQTFKGCAWQR